MLLEYENGARRFERWADVDEESGRFAFDRLEAAAYRVDVISDELAYTRLDGVVVGAQPEEELVIPMSRGATARGIVVDSDGAPLGGVSVAVPDVNYHGRLVHASFGPAVTSNADGHFDLGGLPPTGEVTLSFAKDGYAIKRVTLRSIGDFVRVELSRTARLELSLLGSGAVSRGLSVTVVEENRRYTTHEEPERSTIVIDDVIPGTVHLTIGRYGLQGQIHQDTVTLEAGETLRREYGRAGGARLSGRIVGKDLSFSQRFQVQTVLHPEYTDARLFLVNSELRYEFEGLAPGRRLVRVSGAPGFATIRADEMITVADGDDLELDVTIHEAGFVGVVRDREGQAIAGAELYFKSLRGGPDAWRDSPSIECRTTSDGKYQLYGVSPGDYRVLCRAPRHTTWLEKRTVEGDGALTPLDIVLVPAGVVRVRCMDSAGSAVSGALVILEGVPPHPLAKPTQTKTDGVGVAVIDMVTPGDWSVVVEAEGTFPHRSVHRVVSGQQIDVLAALRRTGTLELVLRDASGLAVPGVAVEIDDGLGGDGPLWLDRGWITTSTGNLVTDPSGRLTIDGVPEGTLTLSVGGMSWEVALVAGERKAVVLTIL